MGECCIKDCAKPSKARGLCDLHYNRMRKGIKLDQPVQTQHHGLSLRDRFMKWIVADEGTGCWIWQGSLNNKGYGQFNLTGKRPIPAHRASWVIHNGDIPANPESAYNTFYVCHRCDNPLCVNPEHLFLSSQQGNMDDKMGKGRHAYGNCFGADHHSTKLTEDLVRQIRASDEGDLAWSRKLGISRATIHAARHRKTWKQVE